MLSRIRNANLVGHERVHVPYTKINLSISRILRDEGFIEAFENLYDSISIKLKFKKGLKNEPYISFIKRVSKPGLRVYVNVNNIPKVLGGIGIAVFIFVFIFVFILVILLVFILLT